MGFRDRDPRGGEPTQEVEGPGSSSLLNSGGNSAKSAFVKALPCSPVSRTWASPGQLLGGERSGWEGDHISTVKVEDKVKVKTEVKTEVKREAWKATTASTRTSKRIWRASRSTTRGGASWTLRWPTFF